MVDRSHWISAAYQPGRGPFAYLAYVPRLQLELRHRGFVSAAAFSPDGTRVVTASGGTARVRETRTAQGVGAPLQHGPA